jgi:hypothetical protein
MTKKKVSKSKPVKTCCTWTGCKKGDWVWTLVAESAIYAFLFCTMRFLEATGNLWWNALILLVLANVFWFACPIIRQHYYCK